MVLHIDLDEDPVNTTPMVDVAFNLLIFFMLSATFMQEEQELELLLPRVAMASTLTEAPDELAINVTEDGQILFQGDVVSENTLVERIRTALANFPDQSVAVRGHRHVDYEKVAQVYSLARKAGVKKLVARVMEDRP